MLQWATWPRRGGQQWQPSHHRARGLAAQAGTNSAWFPRKYTRANTDLPQGTRSTSASPLRATSGAPGTSVFGCFASA